MNAARRIRLPTLQGMKEAGEKIACLAVYDASVARLSEAAGVDVLLIGDSLGMVLQGADSTLRVQMTDMVYHARCVAAGRSRALLLADMPFMSYSTEAQAVGNAARLFSEAGVDAVKMEGGRELCPIVSRLVAQGMPVCAHLGLMPQFVHRMGGHQAQGLEAQQAGRISEDALLLQEAGASLLVLECVPAPLAATLRQRLRIPVIGIGAGVDCDGQVLVAYDVLGLSSGYRRFSRVFLCPSGPTPAEALSAYVTAVRQGQFPGPEQSLP